MGEVGAQASAKWKEHAGSVLAMVQNDRRLRCYGNGSEKVNAKTFKPWDGYEGNIYITANSDEDRPPQMVRLDGTICDNANTMERSALARKLYGGCYVNAILRVWLQDNEHGRAVRCELLAIQFADEGVAFGDAPPDLNGHFGQVTPQGQQPAPGGTQWPPQPMPGGMPQMPPQQPMPWQQPMPGAMPPQQPGAMPQQPTPWPGQPMPWMQ